MVSPAIVLARYLTAFDDHLDYDEPEDPVDALRNQEFAYWDKVDDAFQRFVKRNVTPLVKNPALPADLGAELALVFERGQGDDASFNTLWVKLPHSKEGCDRIVIDTDWEWYVDELKKRLRTVKPTLTGADLRSAAGRCESILLSLMRHYEGVRSLKEEGPVYDLIREKYEDPWREACSKIIRLAEYKASYMSYAYDASDLASTFKEVATNLQTLYKKELRPVYERAWKEVCHLQVAIEFMGEGWRRYRNGISAVKKDWADKSPLSKALETTKESWEGMAREVNERQRAEYFGLSPEEKKQLSDQESALRAGVARLLEIDHEIQRAVRNYSGWPKESPKTAMAAGAEALGAQQKIIAKLV